ncbi:hypothetical protein ANN_16406 [Periplaneta americana]|uniref:Uncharacterized protein n=1 Tax=Periplaneta americana TaxID=6978 RepID=A0ABQ8SJV5_PERAM|nr:hypothetical protein ANN_16406 [Periplaneta americana]
MGTWKMENRREGQEPPVGCDAAEMQPSPLRSARRHSLTTQISRRSPHCIMKADFKFHPCKLQVTSNWPAFCAQLRTTTLCLICLGYVG